jgi:flavin reductase (DIM6/NTAB) family NADH-FMN oxidoreductase RutF
MRSFVAAVTVVAARSDGGLAGLTATAICSVSMTPPLLLACINAAGRTHQAIARSGYFSVNLLAADQQPVAANFSRGQADPSEAFDGFWATGQAGVPILANGVASIACRVCNQIRTGTHTIFIGEVIEVHLDENRPPLLYAAGCYHAIGPTLMGGAHATSPAMRGEC